MFALFVERVFELAVRMANRQYRTRSFIDNTFGHTTHQDVSQTGTAVGTHHDQIDSFGLRRMDDFEKRRSDAHQTPRFKADFAKPRDYLIEFLQRHQALFFSDSIDSAHIQAGAQIANHHWSEWLINVHHDHLGTKLLREFNRVA